MKTLLTAIFNFLGSINPLFTTAGVVLVSVMAGFNWMNTQWAAMLAKVDAFATSTFAGTVSVAPLGLIDTFFPLTEALSFFSIYLGIIAAAAAVRIVKSFIPTVAS